MLELPPLLRVQQPTPTPSPCGGGCARGGSGPIKDKEERQRWCSHGNEGEKREHGGPSSCHANEA